MTLPVEDVETSALPTWPQISPAIHAAVSRVVGSGHWFQSGGGEAERLEERFTKFHNCLGTVAVSNGTHAMELALRAFDIGPGDDVLVPALTFISTASAVSFVGARPIPVDVDPDTLCIDAEDARKRLTPRTKAVMPVHLSGIPSDMTSVQELADEASLHVIEDCAQAFGSTYKGRVVGAIGAAGTFSFQASKHLGAGEGGALTVRDDNEMLDRSVLLANCGRPRGSGTFDHILVGSNYRLTEFQSAIVLAQMDAFPELAALRDKTASQLCNTIMDEHLGAPVRAPANTTVSWFALGIRTPAGLADRSSMTHLVNELSAEGVVATTMYRPFAQTNAFQFLANDLRDGCPVAERAAEEVILIRHPVLLAGQRGIDVVVDVLRRNRRK